MSTMIFSVDIYCIKGVLFYLYIYKFPQILSYVYNGVVTRVFLRVDGSVIDPDSCYFLFEISVYFLIEKNVMRRIESIHVR
jgi:hypothetical protein